ncbi:hypothetical protein RhiirA1_476334 [Rhizophagus irregularis]|uniref:Uncharacterized protein n=1 Tax=Rhizophagus irregularis TaxID=588596 RepID=A0A2I1FE34_9GLOM|nr:hypothetical protein RhiirA1_476334 [Rhizophagus irregularis]PKY32655.1 hypothetical protein RhiirB3_451004 [Rhizophagus irregularis]
MPGNTSDQENVENEIQVEEDSTYPLDSNILYRERINNITKRSFNYNIIKEGVYPNGMESKSKKTNNTSRKKSYKIPYGYVVETTWGRGAKKRTSLKPETKAKISGPLLFGLQLDSVRKARETRKRGNLIKPAIDCIPLTLEKCAKKITTRIQFNFKNDVKGVYHQSDQVILKNVEFSVNEMNYFQVNYGSESEINKTYKLHSVVKAVDQGQILRDSYRELAAVEAHLPRENSVSNERIAITNSMNQLVKVLLIDMNGKDKSKETFEFNDESEFTNPEITQEVIDTMGVGVYQSVKDILYYIIPYLKEKKY